MLSCCVRGFCFSLGSFWDKYTHTNRHEPMEEESRHPSGMLQKETSDERLEFRRLPLNPCDISGIIQKSSLHSSPFWPSSPLVGKHKA
jgi:hypothetical protein